ncbi:hypothetical protein [Aurantimonas sp. 22II-16-19i]|uniref:hypothetical protein n=1 Tax=Aurantimonas sp. 22II-16-19i TaxID=1317114 RepID=UPI0009F7AA00|nr:hypothetical protein [Aurantimonas sp. 22II-16-19i]ORE97811.1 hypothetical protein ATO4_07725 [Aurantimonas sp. 22II-16-19i]
MAKWRIGSLVAASSLAAAVLCGPALADEVTYQNQRFGTKASFPAEAFPEKLPAPVEGDGLAWASPDGAQLFIYARQNGGGETPASIIRDRGKADDVTYKASGQRWAVVSGYRDGKIFYERYIFRGDLIHSVAIRYPKNLRSRYDRLVGPVTNSLQGPSG